MLSDKPRCHYQNNPLAEVICQLRFPEVDIINSATPTQFQEAIRNQYPQYSMERERPVGKQSEGILNHQFVSNDGVWRVNLTNHFISLSCNRYSSWEQFANRLDIPLAAFIQIYKPDGFNRVGLRYVNFFSRKRLQLEGVPFSELFDAKYLGLMADDALQESSFHSSIVEADIALEDGCRVKIHSGPGMVKRNGHQDPDINFVLDCDYYIAGNTSPKHSASSLEKLHSKTYPVFRGAITNLLHNAMEPDE